MLNAKYKKQLKDELKRLDSVKTAKRHEKVIEGFTSDGAPKAKIGKKEYGIFNSNDYLGLRHNKKIKTAEHKASDKFGTGPGAVRFISGTMKPYVELENEIAKFHGKQAGMVVSSAFAANLATISSLLSPQSKDSKVEGSVVVISDALNHRSIIDGVRVASLKNPESKQIYQHMDYEDLDRVLDENSKKFDRAVVITDGVFSMIGEYADVKALRRVVDKYQSKYTLGVMLIVDDSHGVAAFGKTGRGCEEVSNGKSDVLVGTFGKGFGADGGYVVADKVVIDYLREAGATYIYSNSFAPGTAGAALESVRLVNSDKGQKLVQKSRENIEYFKTGALKAGFKFVCDSQHPIQALLIADPVKCGNLTAELFKKGFLVTNISYPIVPKGMDEIRVQISAAHTKEDIDEFVNALISSWK